MPFQPLGGTCCLWNVDSFSSILQKKSFVKQCFSKRKPPPEWLPGTAREESAQTLYVGSLPQHGVGHLEEARDVRACHQVALYAILL